MTKQEEDSLEKFVLSIESAQTRAERRKVIESMVKVSELLDYDKFVDDSWFYSAEEHGSCPELAYTGLKLSGEAGETAEKIGKAYRDNHGVIQDELLFLKELGDILFYVVKLAHLRGKTLEDVARINVEKLRDRQARGKMHGNGDAR